MASLLLGALTACSSSVVFDDGAGGEGGGASNVSSGTDDSTGAGVTSNVLDHLMDVPGLTIRETTPHYPGYRSFEGTFRQPADHAQPDGLQYEQRIRIMHRDMKAPTVLFSTGYGLIEFDSLSEPALLVDGNQVSIEHRFFAPSRPEPADWQTLTIEQSATDHHRLIVALKAVYGERWLSTGSSKGGMAALYHRRFFPQDVEGTIAYVTPLSYGLRDERYIPFLDQVANPLCRETMKAFQLLALTRRDQLRPMLTEQGFDFGSWGADAAIDFGVQWLRFTAWQYAGEDACVGIPTPAASDQQVFDYLMQYSPITSLATEELELAQPYYFQAAVELGDPAIDESYLAPSLTVALGMDASDLVTPGPTNAMVFDAGAMPDVQDWVLTEGSQLLLVYGEYDPWSAAAIDVSGGLDSHRFVAPLGTHGAGIDDLWPESATAAEDAIARWAGIGAPVPTSASHRELARLARLTGSLPPGAQRRRFESRAREVMSEIRQR